MKRRHGWSLLSMVVGVVACQTSSNTVAPVAPPAPTETAATAPAPAEAAATAPVASSVSSATPADTPPADASPSGRPKMCGCSLCAPLPSTDACSADADCAPSTPCHAAACVAKAKAIPRKPDQACTMMMGCQTADANACTCWKGTCALTPRKP